MTEQPPVVPRVGVIGVLAFLCELAMIALLAVAGWRLGTSGWASIGLAVGFCALALGIWARWMAPTSAHRLRRRPRFAAQTALFLTVGAVGVHSGLTAWGVAFAVVATGVFAAAREPEAELAS